MGYESTYNVAVDPDHVFRKQVASAIHSCAVDVINEDPGTENHSARLTWARKITESEQGPVTEAGKWIWKMLENPTFASNPLGADDGAVKTIAAGHVNTFANR